jgi:hypothetical protein
MTLLIILNFVILSLDRYPNNESETKTLSYVNDFLTLCFLIEMIIRVLALGVKEYAADRFNFLDGIIVCISVTDMIISFTIK